MLRFFFLSLPSSRGLINVFEMRVKVLTSLDAWHSLIVDIAMLGTISLAYHQTNGTTMQMLLHVGIPLPAVLFLMGFITMLYLLLHKQRSSPNTYMLYFGDYRYAPFFIQLWYWLRSLLFCSLSSNFVQNIWTGSNDTGENFDAPTPTQ